MVCRVSQTVCVLFLVVLSCMTAPAPGAQPPGDAGPMLLWYDHPAGGWTEALPVGNGRLGAMHFGGVESERLQFNDDTLWTGAPRDYSHEGAKEYLAEIRQLLFDGKQREAQQLATEHFMSQPLRQMAYQPFGDLRLDFDHSGASDYRRQLDLRRAVSTVRYRLGEATYTREVFCSFPDQVLVVRLTCDKPGQVSFRAGLDTPHPDASIETTDAGHLLLQGQLREYKQKRTGQTLPSILKYAAHLLVRTDGGQVTADGGRISVDRANSATLLLAAGTSFRNFQDTSGDPSAATGQAILAASSKLYEQLLDSHVADHGSLFGRVTLDLGVTDAAQDPTDQRIREFSKRLDPQLAALYFQYGRYLLIASSRPGSQPANLQGIWNDRLEPPWESKWTTNINTEMNYWPAEVTNLSDCHEPLFDMLDDLVISGKKTAAKHYGCRGWVLHHNTDLWRGTAPINASNHGIWPTGGAWLCQHLWEHYLFTQDDDFLAQRAYPVLKGAGLFFIDFLVEDPQTGWLISTPSNSPENGGLVAGPTMDHQIIRALFRACIGASERLDVDSSLRAQWKEMLPRIAPNQIGQHGQLQEWLEDKDNPKNQHRHVSHLWGLHPGCEITPRGTPEICAAAKQSLEFRGDGGTGWSLAWKVNFWARLEDGPRAYRLLSNLLTPQRTFPNMFDAHPPFQIDGNFGGASGIAEMLLQSHAGEIAILPAWPSEAWSSGCVRGLRARGGVEIDICWREGRAQSCTLKALADGAHHLRPPQGHRIAEVHSEGRTVPVTADEQGCIDLTMRAGDQYVVSFE